MFIFVGIKQMPTNKDGYMAEYRKLRAENKKIVSLCSHCQERVLKGALSKARGICSKCWKKTAEGRAETAAAVKKHRKVEKKLDQLLDDV
jgi:Zn finger protein HypA/HybF involved in hydrogenase expression